MIVWAATAALYALVALAGVCAVLRAGRWAAARLGVGAGGGGGSGPPSSVRTLLVRGSGGHTAGLLSVLGPCERDRFSPRVYVRAETDSTSEVRAQRAEKGRGDVSFCTVPRAREVGQSWLTTVGTTAFAAVKSAAVVWRTRPGLVVCNGPGTCLPIALAAALFAFTGLSPPCKVVFVESFCRVRTLSLTGRLLYPFASVFVVQWPDLAKKYPRAQYLGRIC